MALAYSIVSYQYEKKETGTPTSTNPHGQVTIFENFVETHRGVFVVPYGRVYLSIYCYRCTDRQPKHLPERNERAPHLRTHTIDSSN